MFLEVAKFPLNSVGYAEANLVTKYELCPFIRFDKTLTCGGQTDRQTDRHGAAAITTLA